MNQDRFDKLMLFVLETVSSEDYLNNLNIYRPKPLSSNDWDKFVKKNK